MGLACLLVGACSNVAGEVGFQPYAIPIKVSVNSWGEISFSVDTNIDLPTPLGVASVGVVVDPARHFSVQNILTVRLNGEEHFYDLHGRDFKIEFESGYYKQIILEKRGGDLFLELSQVDRPPTPQTVQTPLPTSTIAPNTASCGSFVDLGNLSSEN